MAGDRPYISVKVNAVDQARLLARLSKLGGDAPRVLVNATNDTLKTARTRASTEIRKDIRPRSPSETPKQYVDRRLKIKNATVAEPVGSIAADQRGLLLTRFDAKYVKSRGGVTVKIKPSGARKLIKDAFIVQNLRNSGASGVAVRDSSKPSGIRILYGPSVSQVFAGELANLQKQLAPVLAKRMATEVSKAARRVGRYA